MVSLEENRLRRDLIAIFKHLKGIIKKMEEKYFPLLWRAEQVAVDLSSSTEDLDQISGKNYQTVRAVGQ